jgi:hypothetical protein
LRSGLLLLLILLEPLLAPAHTAGQRAHRRARGGPSPRVARDRATYCSKCGAAPRASHDMPLRRHTLIRCGGRVRGDSLGFARIESGCLAVHE